MSKQLAACTEFIGWRQADCIQLTTVFDGEAAFGRIDAAFPYRRRHHSTNFVAAGVHPRSHRLLTVESTFYKHCGACAHTLSPRRFGQHGHHDILNYVFQLRVPMRGWLTLMCE